MAYRGAISLNVRLLPGSNITLTGGTSDGAGGVYLTDDVTITASGGGGGSYSAGTGLTLTGSVFAVAFGTSSSTVCVGNDSRVTGAVQGSTLTTRGDLFVRGASTIGRLALGSTGQVLHSDGTDAGWVTLTASDVGAIAASTLTTRGDILVRSASAPARLAIGAANTVLMTDGTDPGWYTVSGLLSVLGSTRGQTLRYGAASAWEAVNAGTSGQVWRSNGTDPAWYTLVASDVGAVPTTRTVNGHALSADITVTASDVSALPTAGGTMSGDIAMGAHAITGLANPTGAQDADTKSARDTAIAAVTTTTLGAVPTGRTLTTTAPLRIDGGASADLSANRTFSINAASTSAAGVVQMDSANPQPLGTAAPGSTGKASDSGHVHALPTLAALGAGLQRVVLPVASSMPSATGAASVQGFVYLDPAAWAITGKALVATLEVMGNTSAAACTAVAALYTSSTGIITDATTTISAQTPTRYTHTLTVPGGATLYELRVTPSGGTGGVDYAVCGANLILTWS